jgi:uncharacterized protein DUF5672
VKPNLKNITLCAASSPSRMPTARALEISLSHCDFADAILFSDQPVQGSFRFVKIDPLSSMRDYDRFIIKELHKHVRTPFILVTQWDGYVIDPSAWNDEFLQYDYIGARWPFVPEGIPKVGNGGFSLRSRRLLETMASDKFPMNPDYVEDILTCVIYRSELESRYQIRFAPVEVADRFAYEKTSPPGPTFGFHGLCNFWRHVPDDELGQILDQIGPTIYSAEHFPLLAANYILQQRWIPLRELYRRWRKHVSFPDVARQLAPNIPPDKFASSLQSCENLLS